jgi:hypothetical protein
MHDDHPLADLPISNRFEQNEVESPPMSIGRALVVRLVAAAVIVPVTLTLGLLAIHDASAARIIAIVYLPGIAFAGGGFILGRARRGLRTGRLILRHDVYDRRDDPKEFRSVLILHYVGSVVCFGLGVLAGFVVLVKMFLAH